MMNAFFDAFTDLPPWLQMFLGLIVIAVTANVVVSLDGWIMKRVQPDRDPRKASWWVWVVFVVLIGGGSLWVVTQPSGDRSGDRWEFARR